MKSAAEGSEIRLTWPATVPGAAGIVLAVSAERIQTQLGSGRKQTYRLKRKEKNSLTSYVAADAAFGDGDTIIAAVMPALASNKAPNTSQYDFLADLRADLMEDVYVATKALGHLPDFAHKSVPELIIIAGTHDDPRIRIEAAASLARLGASEGWARLESTAIDNTVEAAYRMETVLILAELNDHRAIQLLAKIANDQTNTSELRAAAAWGLSTLHGTLAILLPLTHDSDELTAVHAIVGASRIIDETNLSQALADIGDDNLKSAGLVRAVLSSKCDFSPELAREIASARSSQRRQWLVYLAAAAGQSRCGQLVSHLTDEIRRHLEFYWTHHASNWTNRLDVADQISFLDEQI